MRTLHQRIAEKFLAKLAGSKEVSADQVERLRTVLADTKKLKPDEFVKVFAQADAGDIK
jgi:hypothetical protein